MIRITPGLGRTAPSRARVVKKAAHARPGVFSSEPVAPLMAASLLMAVFGTKAERLRKVTD